MNHPQEKPKILVVPLVVAIILLGLSAFFLYAYVMDNSKTTSLMVFGAIVIALRTELNESGIYRRWSF